MKKISLIGFAMLLFSGTGWAGSVGNITRLSGVMHAMQASGVSGQLSVNSGVREGDTLKTEKGASARISFSDGGVIILRPETELRIEAYSYQLVPMAGHPDNIVLNLIKGGLNSETGLLGKRSPNNFKVNTSVATIRVRGTHFNVLLCNNDCGSIPPISGHALQNGLYADTTQGKILVANFAGSIEVPAGSFSYTPGPNMAPRLVPPGYAGDKTP